jgi:hypothetical protein
MMFGRKGELERSVPLISLGADDLPIIRPGVVGILSFFGIGESLRLERADATLGPVGYKLAAF